MPETEHKRRVVEYFSATRIHWDRIYENASSLKNRHYQLSQRKEAILARVRNRAGGGCLTILDAGCGAGVLCRCLAEDGHRVIGLDLTPDIVGYACSQSNTGECYLAAELERLALKDGLCDVVICSGVLSWLPDDQAGLREMVRVLKQGGCMLVTFPNRARIDYLLDPAYILRGLGKVLGRLPSSARSRPETGNGQVRVRKYFLFRLRELFSRHPVRITGITHLGFGPLTIFRREILPRSISEAMESAYLSLLRFSPCAFLGVLANHWVVEVEKV
jgi:2-polyprenyl-3-methyl-5-hydroxy-6-metoxy-1,4-benzoquinol methylase